MMQRLPARTLLPVLIAAYLCNASCQSNGCGAPPSEQVVTDTPSAGRSSLPLLHLVPASAPWLLHISSWQAASALYEHARPRLLPLTEVGVIETDLRNTLGLDPRHPERQDRIGLDPGGTLVASQLPSGGSFLAFEVADAARLTAHVESVLAGEPFRYSGSTERRTVGDGTVLGFRRTDVDPISVILVVHPSWGALVPESADMDGASALLGLAPDGGMAASSVVVDAVEHVGDHSLLIHLTPAGLQQLSRATPLAALVEGQSEQLRAFEGATAFFDLQANQIQGTITVDVTERAQQQFQSMLANNDRAPGFAGLAQEGTFAILRFTLDATNALSLWKSELSDTARASVDEELAAMAAQLGGSLEQNILPALGRCGLVMATRTRMLSLRRAVATNPPDWFGLANSLGLIVAVEVRQRAPIELALQTLAARSPDRFALLREDGNVVIEINDPNIDLGAVVLTSNLLLLVPTRERDAILAGFAEGSGATLAPGTERLFSDPVFSGGFLDLNAIATGPVGTVLTETWPAEARQALGNLGTVQFMFDPTAALPTATFDLQLQPLSAPAAE